METVAEKKSRLKSLRFWSALLALSSLVIGGVLSNLENNLPFLLLFMVGAVGTSVLSFISMVLGLSAYAQSPAAAKRPLEFGIAGIILIFIMSVFIPNRENPRLGANEDSAVGSLRTIRIATDMYAKAHPECGFPVSLGDLSDFVDGNLASGIKSGYNFIYTPRSTHHDGKLDAYDAIAAPVVLNVTGSRYFFSNETGVISFSKLRDPSGKKPL